MSDYTEHDDLDLIDLIISPVRAVYYYLQGIYYGLNIIEELKVGIAVFIVTILLNITMNGDKVMTSGIVLGVIIYCVTLVKINGGLTPEDDVDLSISAAYANIKEAKEGITKDTSRPMDMADPQVRREYYGMQQQQPNTHHEYGHGIGNMMNKFRNRDHNSEHEELLEEYERNMNNE